MPVRFFTVPALHPEPAASEVNHCLATQRVAQVERYFVADSPGYYWAVCVTVPDGADERRRDRREERSDASRRRSAVDYREGKALGPWCGSRVAVPGCRPEPPPGLFLARLAGLPNEP